MLVDSLHSFLAKSVRTLYLVNSLQFGVQVDVSLYDMSGSMLTTKHLYMDGLLPNIELLAKDESHWQNFGNHPWTVENGIRSTLFLFNHSATSRTITVRIGSGAAVWLKYYDLEPSETRALAINDLIQNQTKDMNGHTVAKTSTSGEVAW